MVGTRTEAQGQLLSGRRRRPRAALRERLAASFSEAALLRLANDSPELLVRALPRQDRAEDGHPLHTVAVASTPLMQAPEDEEKLWRGWTLLIPGPDGVEFLTRIQTSLDSGTRFYDTSQSALLDMALADLAKRQDGCLALGYVELEERGTASQPPQLGPDGAPALLAEIGRRLLDGGISWS